MTLAITLTRGYLALVDDIDADLAEMKWTAVVTESGIVYARHWQRIDGKQIALFMHRAILQRKLGLTLSRLNQCDHILGDGLDNRRDNLRLATNTQNQHNRALGRNNSSGIRGVRWVETRQKWDARIVNQGEVIFLGLHKNFDDAVKARRDKELELYGEFSLLASREV